MASSWGNGSETSIAKHQKACLCVAQLEKQKTAVQCSECHDKDWKWCFMNA